MNRFARRENFAHPVRTPLLREHFVYRGYDADGVLLYVGCTKGLAQRIKDHEADHRWIHLARSFRLAGPFNYETARELEREAIHTERPLYNQTPESRAHSAAYDRVFKRRFRHLLDLGMDWTPAVDAATRHATRTVGAKQGRGPFVADDLTVSRAKAADAADAAKYGGAA